MNEEPNACLVTSMPHKNSILNKVSNEDREEEPFRTFWYLVAHCSLATVVNQRQNDLTWPVKRKINMQHDGEKKIAVSLFMLLCKCMLLNWRKFHLILKDSPDSMSLEPYRSDFSLLFKHHRQGHVAWEQIARYIGSKITKKSETRDEEQQNIDSSFYVP